MKHKSGPGASDRLRLYLSAIYRDDRLTFACAMLAGLAAHTYAFTNKLVNHDEIESLFGKGATVTSGRWGLEAVKLLFPDWSMPWLYGIISLLLISAAVCIAVRVLGIKRPWLRALLAALVTVFPSLTGNLCFMFTSSSYALAFFLSVLAVYEAERGGTARTLAAIAALVLALGIYQAYISVTASLFILLMLRRLFDGDGSVKDTVLYGVRALVLMALSVGIYYAVTLLVFRFTGSGFNDYVSENVNGDVSLPRRIRMAYDAFLYIFTFRNFYLITTEFSRYIHIVLAVLTVAGAGALVYKRPLSALLCLILLALLPLSICCMYMIMSPESIHTLVMYGFVSVYMLAALVAERLPLRLGSALRSLTALLLSFIVACNICFANMVYLKLHLQYENMYAFYSALVTRIQQTEGYDETCSLAIVGTQDNLVRSFPELDTELFLGVNDRLINAYSKESFIRNYLGFDIPFADDAAAAALEEDGRVALMPEYPYYGSVQRIDDHIVVKFG